MRKQTSLVLVTGALAAFILVSLGAIAIAANDDSSRSKYDRDSKSHGDSNDAGDREQPVPARDAEEAARAALKAVGGGTVEDVDRDSEGGAVWEVEITRPDGSKVDVLLDARFEVISVGGEQEPSEAPDDSNEDRDSD